ncbi:polyketide synthase dehydratase domain-containing protein, partial [Microbispora corallina]|uniref:polyketide synthase dehydratase domain-containing protein n=1 Tax=Microbispora corallina TaxID=83302 RepID=UPI0031E12A17
GHTTVDELLLHAPLPLTGANTVQVQVILDRSVPDRTALDIYSRPESGGDWTHHATAVLVSDGAEPGGARPSWPPRDADALDVDDVYEALTAAGLHYGPAFRGLRAAWRRGNELFAEVALPEDRHDEAGRFGIHPALLDAAVHLPAWAGLAEVPEGRNRLPFAWSGVRLHASGATHLRVHVVLG